MATPIAMRFLTVPNGSAKEVYMLADNRMYEMKREHHEKNNQEVTANA